MLAGGGGGASVDLRFVSFFFCFFQVGFVPTFVRRFFKALPTTVNRAPSVRTTTGNNDVLCGGCKAYYVSCFVPLVNEVKS